MKNQEYYIHTDKFLSLFDHKWIQIHLHRSIFKIADKILYSITTPTFQMLSNWILMKFSFKFWPHDGELLLNHFLLISQDSLKYLQPAWYILTVRMMPV